jgi:hypothetical protein
MFMRQVNYFINKYNEFVGKPAITLAPIKFVRNTMIDFTLLVSMRGILSDRTLLELLPFNIDVDKELEQIAKESEGIKLGDGDGE